jgi:hypothetical protein
MGIFAVTRAGRIRRRAIGASLSVLALALAGVVAGGAAPARALSTAAAGPAGGSAGGSAGVSSAGVSCPAGTTAAAAISFSWAASGVPWRRVGRGWILGELATSQSATGPGTLYVVSPGGQRYRLGRAPANAMLEDWSGTGADALFLVQGANSTAVSIIVLNLHTGRGTRFTAYSGTPFPGLSFSRPTGTAVLFQGGATPDGGFLPVQRFSLTGVRELCYPTQFPRAGAIDGRFLENASGTELVFDTQNGLEVVSNAGRPIRALATHGPGGCGLLDWWSSQSVLTDCSGQLLAYPLSGGRPDQLTSSRDTAAFLGAWHLASGNYAEAAACGSTWLERLNRNGTATILTIPGAVDAGTVQPFGTYGDQLPLLIGGGCDGHVAFSFVDWYNPSANTARTVFGGRAGGGYVTDAILFGAG